MRTSAYDAPASFAALSASFASSTANASVAGASRYGVSRGGADAPRSRGPAIDAAATAAPVFRKSRREFDMSERGWRQSEDDRRSPRCQFSRRALPIIQMGSPLVIAGDMTTYRTSPSIDARNSV